MKVAIHIAVVFIALTIVKATQAISGSVSIFGGQDTVFTAEDIERLPAADQTASLLESAYLPAVLANPDTGGLSLTEKPLLNAYGSSILWQQYYVNGAEVTDPANPGQSLIDMPLKAVDSLTMRFLSVAAHNNPGTNWQLKPDNSTSVKPLARPILLYSSFTSKIGGPSFMPNNTLDREPGYQWGAPKDTRYFKPSFAAGGSYSFRGFKNRPAYFYSETNLQQRHFLNLNNELSSRSTILFNQNLKQNRQFFFGQQLKTRENEGIEYGNKVDNTLKSWQLGAYSGLSEKVANHHQYSFGVGLSINNAKLNSNSLSRSLLEEIHHGPMPQPTKKVAFLLQGNLVRSNIQWFDALKDMTYISAKVRLESISERQEIPSNVITRSYNGKALDVTLYEEGKRYNTYLMHARPAIGLKKKYHSWKFDSWLGALAESGFSQKKYLIGRIDPTAGFTSTIFFKKIGGQFFTGIQHEAIRLTYADVSFLNSNGLSGQRYLWLDNNNDGSYQAGEQQSVLNRTGGKYRNKAAGLDAPVMEELTLGYLQNLSERWLTSLTFAGRIVRNLLQVQYDPQTNAQYNQISSGATQKAILFDRQPASYGQEIYQLANNDASSYFASLEFQVLRKQIKSWWYINFSFGTYIQLAEPPPGNGPLFNDIAIISESTADPNSTIADPSRTDYDRAFIMKFMFGFEVAQGLHIDNTIHYRDGQPFASYVIAQSLSSGPAPIMTGPRAGGLSGLGRYTYFASWDVRIRYDWQTKNSSWFFTVDIFNLTSSSVPFSERVVEGQLIRRPTENIPPRTMQIALGSRF